MNVEANHEQAEVIKGLAHALNIPPNEIAQALIEAGITWLTARNIGQPLDLFPIQNYPKSHAISRALGNAYKKQARPRLAP